MDKLEVLVDMSFGRLEFPYELTGKARENYREYIRKNLGDIAEYLVKQEDMHRLEVISSQKLWTLEELILRWIVHLREKKRKYPHF